MLSCASVVSSARSSSSASASNTATTSHHQVPPSPPTAVVSTPQKVTRPPNREQLFQPVLLSENADDLKRRLTDLNPSGTISVELPFQGNGFLYQARTAVSGVVFYGRSSVEDEAVVKCCKKAINHILQTQQQVDRNGNNICREGPSAFGADVPSAFGRKQAPNRSETAQTPHLKHPTSNSISFRGGREPVGGSRVGVIGTGRDRFAHQQPPPLPLMSNPPPPFTQRQQQQKQPPMTATRGNGQCAPPPPGSMNKPATTRYENALAATAHERRSKRERELRSSDMGGVMAMLDKFSGPSQRGSANSRESGGSRQNRRGGGLQERNPNAHTAGSRFSGGGVNSSPLGGKKPSAVSRGGRGAEPRQSGLAQPSRHSVAASNSTSNHHHYQSEGAQGDRRGQQRRENDDRACNERKFQETAASVEVASQQQPPSQVTDQTSTVIGQQGIVQPLIQFEGMNLKQIPIKNAVMMLNEMFPPPKAPQYKVTSQTGPPNNPTFTMVCTIEDQNFPGIGQKTTIPCYL